VSGWQNVELVSKVVSQLATGIGRRNTKMGDSNPSVKTEGFF
jgi:hypothetical protein